MRLLGNLGTRFRESNPNNIASERLLISLNSRLYKRSRGGPINERILGSSTIVSGAAWGGGTIETEGIKLIHFSNINLKGIPRWFFLWPISVTLFILHKFKHIDLLPSLIFEFSNLPFGIDFASPHQF